MTPHNEAKLGEIAKTVLMPGDPLRAKYIAENFLENYKLVNKVRGMYAYTGKYKGKEITVMASGMGIPSIGIYSYELYKFYNVENIIRIGTSGANRSDIKLLDIILASSSYSLSTFLDLFDEYKEQEVESSDKLNKIIENTANNLNINIKKGKIITSDVFNPYVDSIENYYNHYPKDLDTLASEMESFALFYMAKKFQKQATCLLTVVDSPYDDRVISSEAREKSLDKMIELALETGVNL